MLLGPIFWKEVKDEPQRRRLFEYLLAYAGVLSAVAAYCCLTGVVGGVARYDFGRGIFAFACWTQAFLGCLLAPMMSAATLCDEKERDSLDILLLTLLSDREIVLSKFASRLLALELFLSTSLPICGLVMSMGGVTFGEMLAGQFYVACALGLAAAAGICCGSLFARTYVAGFVAYPLLALICLAPAWHGAAESSPLLALFQLLHRGGTPPVWTAGLWYSLAFIVLLLAIAVRKLNSQATTHLWSVASLLTRRLSDSVMDLLPARLRATRLTPVRCGRDAVLWRETRGKSPRNSPALFVIYLLMALGGLAMIPVIRFSPMKAELPYYGLMAVGIVLTVLATVSGALSFSREKENGALNLLTLAPLEPEQIVEGKLLGIQWAVAPVLIVATTLTVVYHMIWQVHNPLTEPFWLLIDAAWFCGMALILRLYTVLAVSRSIQARTSMQALMHSLLQMGAIFIVTTFPCQCAGALNPIMLSSVCLASLDTSRGTMLSGMEPFVLLFLVIDWLIVTHITRNERAKILAFYDRDISLDPEAALWRQQALPRVDWRKKL